jgi:hypothetical protein
VQVADCYVHVKYRELYPQEFDRFSRRLLEKAGELAQDVRRGMDLDFTFEEGSIYTRAVVIGQLLFAVSTYHELRLSVNDLFHEGETFSNYMMTEFHQLTNTAADDNIYTRTTSRDMNRVSRIVHSFDEAAKRQVPPSELAHVRSQVIHDLAGLARANPDSSDVTNILCILRKGPIPDLPKSPAEAIANDEIEYRYDKFPYEEHEEPDRAATGVLSDRPRRRFHKRLAISNRRTR